MDPRARRLRALPFRERETRTPALGALASFVILVAAGIWAFGVPVRTSDGTTTHALAALLGPAAGVAPWVGTGAFLSVWAHTRHRVIARAGLLAMVIAIVGGTALLVAHTVEPDARPLTHVPVLALAFFLLGAAPVGLSLVATLAEARRGE